MVRWDKRLINKASDVPSCKLQNSLQKLFQFISLFLYKFTKTRIKSFECPKSTKNCEKNNAQNICESFDPATQQASVLYWRLLDFIMQWICDSKSTFYWVLKWSGHNSSEAKFLFYHFCFPISKYFYHHIRFLLNRSIAKSDNEIGKYY